MAVRGRGSPFHTMAKDPAFLFYPGDFLTGVQDLTMEERGQYITLLCLQHQKGHLTEKMIRLSCGNAAADVMAKFKQDPEGNFYNQRLELEMEKRAAHGEKQRLRAVEGWKKRKDNDNQSSKEQSGNAAAYTTAYAMALPLEDKNENRNRVEDKDKIGTLLREKFPFPSAEAKKALQDYIQHRRQLKVKPYTLIGLEKAMEEWATWGESTWIEAVYKSIQNNYQGVFHPTKSNQNGNTYKRPETPFRKLTRTEPPPHGTPFGKL